MSRKTLIDQNINRHTKELEESLKYIMPNLIAAFIKVYGEKYREHITYTIECKANCCVLFFKVLGQRKMSVHVFQTIFTSG